MHNVCQQRFSRTIRYGFLWNMPNYGGVEFGAQNTTWTGYSAKQIDYWIGTFAEKSNVVPFGDIMHSYVDAVGHAPMLPSTVAGYWHSKNRYSSQDEILAVVGFPFPCWTKVLLLNAHCI